MAVVLISLVIDLSSATCPWIIIFLLTILLTFQVTQIEKKMLAESKVPPPLTHPSVIIYTTCHFDMPWIALTWGLPSIDDSLSWLKVRNASYCCTWLTGRKQQDFCWINFWCGSFNDSLEKLKYSVMFFVAIFVPITNEFVCFLLFGII